jgi:hypothetical protein
MRDMFASVRRQRLALGLFLLRVVVAVAIVSRHPGSNLVEQGAAFLLLVGMWTTAVGALICVIEVWGVVSGTGGWVPVLVATITSALALAGPGAWSVDAQLRGWHRIEIPPREPDRNTRPS